MQAPLHPISRSLDHSEFHAVGLVILGKAEAGGHVLGEEGLFFVLDILDECIVHGLVQSLATSVQHLLLAFLEELVVGLALLVVTGEVLIGDLVNVDTGEVNLGAGGDGVNLVDAFEGHAVDLVGTSHKQEAAVETLKENNSRATESTAEQDQDLAGFNTLAQLGDASLLSSWLSLLVFCGVPLLELFDH